jgi:hypothetical protein
LGSEDHIGSRLHLVPRYHQKLITRRSRVRIPPGI